ncbi:MAG: 1,4-alpha-glucan branching protein GlgB [Chloroflexota bacterium]|nr:1,4-alpha-glucan branching protein GlgB [Chloroflexota bacterium]
MTQTLHPDAIQALLTGEIGAPSSLLGRHQRGGEVSIRSFRPWAKRVDLVNNLTGERAPMRKQHEEGLFVAALDASWADAPYSFEAETLDGAHECYSDPYIFPPLLSDYDIYLFGQGQHKDIYRKLGAHRREIDGIPGVNFAVWAPNCYKVALVGDFNRWDARVHIMENISDSGIWEIFLPGLEAGARYKYEVRSHNRGYRAEKSDPYGFYAELRPQTASIVYDIDQYQWQDSDWMAARARGNPLSAPMNIYELHLGSWKRKDGGDFLSYRELADELLPYLIDMGYTHLELLPVAEHPLDASWGYQVTGYFAPTSRYGAPADFMQFVDRCHQNNIAVILDWVPAHFPKDGHGLNFFDGTHLYSHEDPLQGEQPDWGTMVFNFARSEVRNFLLANALFWLKEYHIDGLRVDAVSSMIYLNFSREDESWVPNEYGSHENLGALAFLREFNEIVHAEAPGAITIAEESTAWAMVSRPTYIGGLGFTFKWNMGWMHDTLAYMARDPVHRRHHHHQITFALLYAFSENFVLPLSHDEVVHMKGSLIGKLPGDYWQKFAGLRLLFGYQFTQVGKVLNFMGNEFAQFAEWSEERSLDWRLLDYEKHRQMQNWARDLNHLYREQPALWQLDCERDGFHWIDANDADYSVYSYIRYAEDRSDFLVVVLNCTPVPRENYRIGVPCAGYYRELLNSDASYYGGGDVGNAGGVHSDDYGSHGQPFSLNLRLPPLGILILKTEAM